MPADDPNGRPPAGGFEGFRSYADDSLRGPGAPEAALADDHLRLAEPGDGTRRRGAPWLPAVAAGGVALALGAGVLLALSDPPPDAREAEAGATLPVEVAELPPPKAPPPSTPLEVLPDARASAAVDLTPAPAAPLPAAPLPAEPADEAEAPELALAPPPRDAVVVEPPPRADPCRNASSRAEEMVCRDPDLAAADRRMRQAYEAALDAGVPEAALALEQQDWRDIREMAAERSPRAVASIYRQRIEELQMMADETWR